MVNPMVPKNNDGDFPAIPGIGMGGITMCPFGFQKTPCLKGGCELWVELDYGVDPKTQKRIKVARCSIAWNSILMTESTREIVRLRMALVPTENVPQPPRPNDAGGQK